MSEAQPWQILTTIAFLLATAEVFTPAFVSLPAGIAFLLTAGVGLITSQWSILLPCLALNLIIVYWCFYSFVWPRLAKTAPKTAADAMAGKIGIVTENINPLTGNGYVKLYGDSWKAIATTPIEKGQRVLITAIEGNKVVVRLVHDDETA